MCKATVSLLYVHSVRRGDPGNPATRAQCLRGLEHVDLPGNKRPGQVLWVLPVGEASFRTSRAFMVRLCPCPLAWVPWQVHELHTPMNSMKFHELQLQQQSTGCMPTCLTNAEGPSQGPGCRNTESPARLSLVMVTLWDLSAGERCHW